MAGFEGNLDELFQLAAELTELATVPSQAAAEVSTEIAALIEAEFDAGQDPYGEAWAPLRPATLNRGRTPPPLTDTTAMRASVLARPTSGAGISVTVNTDYATFHQTGTADMVARPILPEDGLPETWEAAIDEAMEGVVLRRALAASLKKAG